MLRMILILFVLSFIPSPVVARPYVIPEDTCFEPHISEVVKLWWVQDKVKLRRWAEKAEEQIKTRVLAAQLLYNLERSSLPVYLALLEGEKGESASEVRLEDLRPACLGNRRCEAVLKNNIRLGLALRGHAAAWRSWIGALARGHWVVLHKELRSITWNRPAALVNAIAAHPKQEQIVKAICDDCGALRGLRAGLKRASRRKMTQKGRVMRDQLVTAIRDAISDCASRSRISHLIKRWRRKDSAYLLDVVKNKKGGWHRRIVAGKLLYQLDPSTLPHHIALFSQNPHAAIRDSILNYEKNDLAACWGNRTCERVISQCLLLELAKQGDGAVIRAWFDAVGSVDGCSAEYVGGALPEILWARPVLFLEMLARRRDEGVFGELLWGLGNNLPTTYRDIKKLKRISGLSASAHALRDRLVRKLDKELAERGRR